MRVQIRKAAPEDADALAALGAETFIDTFGALYSKKNLNAFLEKNHTANVYRAMIDNPQFGIFIAESEASAAIGYAVAGPCGLPVPNLPPRSGELGRLYMKPGMQGGGVGARLLDAALAFMSDRYDHIYLSVYSENYGAQRFYERFGFVKIHDHFYMVGDQADPDWIMELKRDQ